MNDIFISEEDCQALKKEQELQDDAINEFLDVMNKYSVSEEDIERIAFLAKWF